MKRRVLLGIALGAFYATFVLQIPHDTPRLAGLETDLTMMYINGAAAIDNMFAGHWAPGNPQLLWPDINPFKAHGIGYPLVLWMFSWPFDDPVPAWSYFTAAKLVSILAAVSVIVLAVVWLGWLPGCVAAVSLAASPLFFRLSYSGCTDLFVAACLLWAAYCLFRRRILLGGLLYAMAVISRYEYLVLLPIVACFIWIRMTEKVQPPAAKQPQEDVTGRLRGLAPAGRDLVRFMTPVAALLIINIVIGGMPASNHTNVAIHYLKDVQFSYDFTPAVQKQYPNYWAILSADPIRTISVFARDLGKTTVAMVTSHVTPVLFVAAIVGLFRIRSRRYWIVAAAVLAHYLALNLFMSQGANGRFFIIEIIGLIFLGSSVFRNLKRWYLLALIPFLILGSRDVAREINAQISSSADGYLALRYRLPGHKTILSMRPSLALVAGTGWRHWKPGIKDIYRYCLEYDIDYLHWTGQEAFHRKEFTDKFHSSASALPEFLTYYADESIGVLFGVKR